MFVYINALRSTKNNSESLIEMKIKEKKERKINAECFTRIDRERDCERAKSKRDGQSYAGNNILVEDNSLRLTLVYRIDLEHFQTAI